MLDGYGAATSRMGVGEALICAGCLREFSGMRGATLLFGYPIVVMFLAGRRVLVEKTLVAEYHTAG